MASEVLANGHTYTPHQPYAGGEQNSYAYADASTSQAPPTSTPSNTTNGQAELSKDEVGWYFVEQYYTTLSRSPDKLYLFYNKRSQFVSGREADKVPVCIGQRAINDKIKQLDFQDCKVRVTNVDSQASDSNIVIQVIGEISNKSQPHKKFTQTFVLGTQTNGYFVLNDIFRYLNEEEDEAEIEDATASALAEPTTNGTGHLEIAKPEPEPQKAAAVKESYATEPDAKKVAQELEDKIINNPTVTPVPAASAENTSATATETNQAASAQEVQPPSTVAALEPETPKDPEPTRVSTPQAAAPQQAPAAPKPVVPKTWASLAASAAGRTPAPVVPAVPVVAPRSTSTGAKAAAPASSSASVAAADSAPAPITTPSQPQRQDGPAPESEEWTSVGTNHTRQQSRPAGATPTEAPQFRGYIKNVHEGINAESLKAALDKFGKVAYFDIARHKNCAFVDFETAEGYNKATSTPIEFGDDKLMVEERRILPGSKPYVNRGSFQGGRGGRGNYNNQGAPRGGFQNNRGNGAPRGRGGAGAGTRGGRGAPAAS